MARLIVFSGSSSESIVLLDVVKKVVQAGERVVLLLIHGACRSAADQVFCQEVRRCGADIYALREDLETQELLEKVVEDVGIVDYDGWVTLLENFEKVFSWI